MLILSRKREGEGRRGEKGLCRWKILKVSCEGPGCPGLRRGGEALLVK